MATTHRSDLTTEIEKALTDEAYDGGSGALTEQQFSRYVRRLAEAAVEVVNQHRADEPHGEPSDARRAPLQAVRGVGPKGTISWEEHLEVWNAYAALHGDRQSAERIAERGGFGHSEVRLLLGRGPRTFRAGGAR